MSAVLLRADGSGASLILDGIVSYRRSPSAMVAQHPVQDLGVVVDHAQRLATTLALEWVCSTTPTIPGITAGPSRIEEVQGWLDEAVGVPLTLVQPGLPPEDDLFLSAHPGEQRGTLAVTFTLAFVRGQVARTRTVELDTEGATTRPGRTARPDQAAGFSPTSDRGNQPTRRKSLAAAGIDALVGAFGGGT